MRIYKMVATFGKLQHQELTLEPGFNVIEAPNEWGKSTWCAFLAAMLYGLDTRAKSSRTALADKEHYQPWGGAPMSGRMDVNWKGRDITIERSTRGRIPMGEFRAYETESGLEVPELTADNCGEMLLGVEQSVFRRAGFIRLADLPVTKNEELSRRLNALVTTGDESGDGDRLAGSLKDLKNKCRYNRTGLLPQAEAERDRLWQVLEEQKNLEEHREKLTQRIRESESWIALLTNHMDHIRCREARQDQQRVVQARQSRDRAREKLQRMEGICGELPDREEAEFRLKKLQQFAAQLGKLQAQAQMLPSQVPKPQAPPAFQNLNASQAAQVAEEDYGIYKNMEERSSLLWILGAVMCWALMGLMILTAKLDYLPPIFCYIMAVILLGTGLVLLILGISRGREKKRVLGQLAQKYGTDDASQWLTEARLYGKNLERFFQESRRIQVLRRDLELRAQKLKQEHQTLCGSQSLKETIRVWQDVSRCWRDLEASREATAQAESHLKDLEAMARAVPQIQGEDSLTNSPEETEALLTKVRAEAQKLQGRLSQLQGRMEAMGDRETLEKQYEAQRKRILRLEEICRAVAVAQANLEAAAQELQRRFSPRISGRAQELMGRMTGGRYSRLTLGEDFSLGTGADQEDTLHGVLWRSDGTADQVYLALRLAVSETLTPEAPLVLDDALVRFDDRRLKAALEILREEGNQKQVILFTCQSREKKLISSLEA